MADPALWSRSRKSVARAFGWGLFVAALPLPGQTVIAALIAIGLRVNLPVAAVTVFVTNPVTMVPIYWVAYRLGAGMLGLDPVAVAIEPSWAWLGENLARVGLPLALGSLLLGALAGCTGYLAVNVIWRGITLRRALRRRRA